MTEEEIGIENSIHHFTSPWSGVTLHTKNPQLPAGRSERLVVPWPDPGDRKTCGFQKMAIFVQDREETSPP